ncbi:MAG: E1 ubiquitin-activating protein uba2 [Phylliscum demangeonii]|nr:MAG: E1 ubiquitin-activating protein uba2 [Phylliscum demangeonii]
MKRDRCVRQSLGSTYDRIKESQVLLVGAGGIGCELLKNLVLTGFGKIHIVDLDTIDLSNLNRQFLFRHEHIKKSKALVAKEVAGRFNPDVVLTAHHANIKDARFTIDWFKSFALVFNALDNIDARRHVNRVCLAADVPLIESGTTGFNGQVQVIKKGETECYDCNVKEAPKTFPVCTIRSTPSQPIHCIVWAKSYLFTELFGTSEADAPDVDHSEDSENAQEIENLKREAQALRLIREARGTEDFPRKVFEKVYQEDIERLRSMEEMWKTRKAPTSLDYDEVLEETVALDPGLTSSNDQRTWGLEENFVVFSDSLHRLSRRIREAQDRRANGDPPAVLTFDKDDGDALDFVTASANLRSIVFDIEPRSKFDIKQMAGNIIPAIATTNAMVAGLCVLQAFKVLRDQLDRARMVFLVKSADRIISSEKLTPPKPDCPVCSVTQSRLEVDPSRATLSDLVEDFLRLELGYGDEFSVNNEIGILYDPDLDENLPKRLTELGVKSDSFLTVIDETDENPRVNLVLAIKERELPLNSKPIVVREKIEVVRRPTKPLIAAASNGNGHVNGAAPPAADGVVNGHASHSNGSGHGKRKRTVDDDELEREPASAKKRGRLVREREGAATVDGDGVVVLDDDDDNDEDGAGNGAIVIDDDD